MAQARQTFERRQLGLTLRRLRERAGKTQQAAANAIGKVRSRVVQLEEGTATASQGDLTKLLDFYRVTDEAERQTVLDFGVQTRKRQRRGPHHDLLPDAYQRFADLEASASEINSAEPGIIPGLLQSPSYVRALFAEAEGVLWEHGAKEAAERLEFRLNRQNRIWDAPNQPIMRFVISEDAVRANMGPGVMREQMEHILSLLNERPMLTVRILRTDTYGNPIRGGGFQVFDFGSRGRPIGLATNSFGPSTYFDDVNEVAQMLRAFHRIWELSLSREETRNLIEHIAKEQ
ncbi:helix-turn-helix domain-containing protein [Amycolatopsis anabasis]|uniref:helix-turn-helix domain-containing protein n=1 Tax=Amycolatopsis anabasis TaxID=1840409 RepID=UPI00131EC0B6|nr:helix-turn-helix transcriptional regulator [Amycolatopsis anabasis]